MCKRIPESEPPAPADPKSRRKHSWQKAVRKDAILQAVQKRMSPRFPENLRKTLTQTLRSLLAIQFYPRTFFAACLLTETRISTFLKPAKTVSLKAWL
jgi:transcriptional accessory protein Tex/SPT6